ncbi:MAG: hypothetical protein JEZ07_15635 [Phycisphaerae bacterium]|nr:hypothetical protein [Phycisphaerae bacterium]
MEFKAKYAWQLPLAGCGVSVIMNFAGLGAKAESGYSLIGLVGALIMLAMIVMGIVYMFRCFGKGYVGHGIGGAVVNLLLVALIVSGIHASRKYREILEPKYTCNESLQGYKIIYEEDAEDGKFSKFDKIVCSLPEGYVKASKTEMNLDAMNIVSLFSMKHNDDKFFVFCKKLGGTIAQDDGFLKMLNRKKIKNKLYNWCGHKVPAMYVYEKGAFNMDFVTINVQIPVLPEALQLSFFGSKSNEKFIESKVEEVLDGIEGFTNWKIKDKS